MSYRHWLILPLVIVAVAAGCRQAVETKPPDAEDGKPKSDHPRGDGHGNSKDHASTGNPSFTLNKEDGILAGLVRWNGPLPEGLSLDPTLTVSVGGEEVPAKLAPRLEVNPETKGVANAVVWLAKGAADRPAPETVKLTQRDGDCQPHVLAVPVGSKLQLVSADDRANFQAGGANHFDVIVQKGKPAERQLTAPGLVEIRSKLAPWLSAYVWVFDHSGYYVTGPDGKFRLPRVQPGEHTVTLWHENWRYTDKKQFRTAPPLEAKVTVPLGKGQGASIEWTLSGGQ